MVIQLAKEVGLQVEEGEWPPDILAQGEEAFITGTVKKVMPVTFLDGRPIGNGKPGPVTQKLMKLYEEFLRKQIQG